MSEDNNVFTLTTPGLLAFPVVTPEQLTQAATWYEKQKAAGNKRLRVPGYEVSLVLDKDHPDLPTMKAAIDELIDANIDADNEGDPGAPLKSGTKMADKRNQKLAKLNPPKDPDREYLRGKMILVARSKYPPSLGMVQRGAVVDLVDSARAANGHRFFPGAEALLQVRFAWYDATDLAPAGGVNAYLNMVVITGGGKRFPGTGGRSTVDAFKGYAGKVTDQDPTRGNRRRPAWDVEDDEIPF